jgi:tetratricopeptide (TPR) repeat protein
MPKHERSPVLPNYLIKRGDAAKLKGDMEQARRYYLSALRLAPNSASAKCRLAALEETQGNLESAKQIYHDILGNDIPSAWRANALIGLANILLEQGNLDEAYEDYAQVLSLAIEETYPGERAWILAHAYCGMGAVEGSRGHVEAACQLYIQALRQAPNHAPSLANLASCYADMGNMEQAIQALYKALQIEPHHAEWVYDMGDLQQEAGRTLLARLWYERALQLGEARAHEALDALPQDTGDQWYDAGKQYEEIGDVATARQCFERAFQLGDRRARKALDSLRSPTESHNG